MSTASLILVTGANGFIGSALTERLLREGYRVRMTGQVCPQGLVDLGGQWQPMADLTGDVDWAPALAGVTAVVHLAGMAHRVFGTSALEAEQFDRVNHLATRSLVAAIRATRTVEKLLFISSVAVHGEPEGFPLRAGDALAPVNPYGLSKMAAECAVREGLEGCAVHWAILRPVLVYGPGNPGNMARLEGLIRRHLPVPVGRTPNRRSFLFLGNLVDGIATYLALQDPPTQKVWIVADKERHSTADLVMAMAKAMGRKGLVLRCPESLLDLTARLGSLLHRLGMPCPWTQEVRTKLLGNFWVDSEPMRNELHWEPPFSLEAGLAETYGETVNGDSAKRG